MIVIEVNNNSDRVDIYLKEPTGPKEPDISFNFKEMDIVRDMLMYIFNNIDAYPRVDLGVHLNEISEDQRSGLGEW